MKLRREETGCTLSSVSEYTSSWNDIPSLISINLKRYACLQDIFIYDIKYKDNNNWFDCQDGIKIYHAF